MGRSLTPPDKARRRNGRESVAAEGAENSRIEPGEPIEETVDFILEAEPTGDVIDKLEKHAIAKPPNTLRATQASETALLGPAADLQRRAGRVIC